MSVTNHSPSSTWNNTDLEGVVFSQHPLLYGAAIYALLLMVIGTIGNILTIIILLRPNLRHLTTMRYLIAVAVADLCSLYSWNLNLFYKHLINPHQNDLEDSSIISCRIVSFFAFVSLQLSSWYLTLVSLDRLLMVQFLVLHRKISRTNHSIYIILSVTIIIALVNSHLLFLNGYQKPECTPFEKTTCFICYARLEDSRYIFPKWETVHVIIYNLIPFSIMLISNCLIIRRTEQLDNNQRLSSLNMKRQPSRKYRQRKQKQLTYLLVFVTFLFVLLTTPVMIYNVFWRNSLLKRRLFRYILHAVLLCAQFTSHAINFFLYCYGASNFRHELDSFIKNCLPKKQDRIIEIS